MNLDLSKIFTPNKVTLNRKKLSEKKITWKVYCQLFLCMGMGALEPLPYRYRKVQSSQLE